MIFACGNSSLARHVKFFILLTVGFVLIVSSACAQGSETKSADVTHAANSDLYIEFIREQVTVKADDIPAEELLLELALRCGLEVFIDGPLQERVSLKINEASLPETLRQILGDNDFSLVYSSPERSRDGSFPAKRGTLWVFTSRSGDRANPAEHVPGSGFNGSASTDEILAGLVQEDARRRMISVRALEALPAEEALQHLSFSLADEDVGVREEAVLALADMGGEEAAMVLATALVDGSSRIREETVYALSEIGDDFSVQLLEQALTDEQINVREATIEAFSEIGGDDSVRALTIALADDQPNLREGAVETLSDIGGINSIHALTQALDDPDENVRAAAIAAVGNVGGEEAVPALAVALQDENAFLREEAVMALGRIGGETADQLLKKALLDSHKTIREAAAEVLKKSSSHY